MPSPCDPIKIPLTSHNEIFTRKSDEGYFYTKMALSAPAGLGKSTISAKIAYDWATGSAECFKDIALLFVLSMRGVNHDSELENVISRQLLSEDTGVDTGQLLSVLAKLEEKVIVILDAVDEADRGLFDHPECSGSIVKLITGTILLSCRLIVTTRPWRLTQITGSCAEYIHLELHGFSKPDVVMYIRKFFARADHSDLRESLIKYLDLNELIAGVAFAPLMALLICLFWKETSGKEVPKRITHLYDAVINIMYDHYLSKQKLPSSSSSGTSETTHVDTIVKHLGKSALKGLWPPQNDIILSLDDDTSPEVVLEAKAIGLISVNEAQESSQRLKFQKGGMRRKVNPSATKSTVFTFFHKSGQEKCAGEYLASLAALPNQPSAESIESYLKGLRSVQDAHSVQLILRFASGASPDAAGLILERLLEIFRSQLLPIIDQYYAETLDLERAQEVQLFVELCLRCNYEAEAGSRFLDLITELFPKGHINFLGLSAFTAVALQYFMLHASQHSIRSAILRPLAHIGDNIWPTGPLWKVHQDARQAVRNMPPDKMKEICREYFENHTGPVHSYNQGIASRAPANLVAFIQVWQACEKLPSDESNISHFIKDLDRMKQLTRFSITGFKVCSQLSVLLDHIDARRLGGCLLEMKVGNTGLTSDQTERLAQLLDKLPCLQILDMSYNEGGHAIRYMSEKLPALESLQQLGVNHLKAPAEDMLLFAERFPQFGSKLTKLYINGNGMNDSVAAKLSEHLQSARDMRTLRIRVGDLSREFHNRLVSSFRHLPKLQEVRTYNSRHVNDLVDSVAGIMTSVPDIRALILHTASDAEPLVDRGIWKNFREKLPSARCLKRLDLSHVALSLEDFQDLIVFCRRMEYTMLE